MTTILVLNAASSLLAAAGIGGYLARQRRRSRALVVQPIWVTAGCSNHRLSHL